ncbi:PREDICTED: uncharacterized protein LOC108968794 [Bactrocera latifrons]|uniref:Uncharacterized protein n=2 Tax=Bactrocera latifrons TaxID=174628 RepID=A0A0K8V7Q2_BACLA|nr:PREDICTED: uncharacterized protein LOC108968794 [Bactrocera latifrons]
MAGLSTHKFCAAFLLVIGVVCANADGTENPEIDMEMWASRNQLLDSMFEDTLNLTGYAFAWSKEVCQKLLDEEQNQTSAEPEAREMHLNNCLRHTVDRLDPTTSRRGDHPYEVRLHKYGFEEFRKVMDQKYEHFFDEMVQRMVDYVKSLTPEQQGKETARNLKGWSGKIKNAPTLAGKEMAFRKCMRFYYFERGV